MSLLDDAIVKADALLQELKAASAQLAAETFVADEKLATITALTRPASAGADPDPPVDEAAPDNALPFKCPGCGATYEKPILCTNGHPAEQTLPTEDVLAGAPPAEQSPAAEPEPSNAVVETGETPPPPAASDPSWPDAQK